MRRTLLLSLFSVALHAEVRTLTLRGAVETAVAQNPDVIMARLEEQKAAEAVRIARDPFSTKLIVGSGLAYTSGFPMSIEGSAPSIVQARANQSLYNKSKSYEVAAARETARGAGIDADIRREDIAYQTALLYLNAQRASRNLDLARQQIESAARVNELTKARVSEGRELPVEAKRTALTLAQSRQRLSALEGELEHLERSLAVILGFGAEDRVRAVADDVKIAGVPESEEASVEAALAGSKEVKRLEAALQARGFEVRSAKASRLPQADLVAQYALFSRFNNYEDFFQRFERHNWQLGVSLSLPILTGSAASARASQAQLEIARLQQQIHAVQDRIALDTRKAYQDVGQAAAVRDLARMDLDLAREQLSVTLAQLDEGRATIRRVEELRTAEAAKWIAFYEAQQNLERSRLALARLTGSILAALH
jgi:outer membrane protein TolC